MRTVMFVLLSSFSLFSVTEGASVMMTSPSPSTANSYFSVRGGAGNGREVKAEEDEDEGDEGELCLEVLLLVLLLFTSV